MKEPCLVLEPAYGNNPEPYIMAYKVLRGEKGYWYVHPYARFKKVKG